MKSFRPKKADLSKNYLVIDLTDMILGRICAKIAHMLKGKHKVTYTPGVDCGDHIIALNASKIRVTGNKMKDMMFYRHTGYIGNMKKMTLEDRMLRDPREVIQTAVKRMLSRGPLANAQLKLLHISADDKHKYTSVKTIEVDTSKMRGL